jgi:hypothetical protein
MDDAALAVVENLVFADAVQNGRTHGLKPGEIRERETRSEGGHRIVEFDGGENASFVDLFNRPARRAIFKSPAEYEQISRDNSLARIDEIIRYRPPLSAPRVMFV